jgi:hypothetical protein
MDERTTAWWNAVLAGEVDEPHPVHGDRVRVRLKGERLELSGVLDRREDRNELVRQARAHIGHGVGSVDVSHLVANPRLEKPGLLDQTIMTSYPDRATAELARKFVVERARVKPRREAIIDRADGEALRKVVPEDYVGDVQRRIGLGEAVLVMRVDETSAFTVRRFLEEETRSRWTMAAPPEVPAGG